MNDILSTFVILLFSLVGMASIQERWTNQERRWIWASFAAHVVSSFALLGVYTFVYKGAEDIFAYTRYAVGINELVRGDFVTYFPELLKAFFRLESELDPYLYSAGSTTGAMSAATAIGFLFTGDSLVGCCVLFTMMSFSSKVAIYLGLRGELHKALHQRLLLGTLLVPSAVFWTAGVVKEALAMFGLGWTFLGVLWLLKGDRRKRSVSLFILPFGMAFIINIKPYILMPLGVAFGAYYTIRRMKDSNRDIGAIATSPLYIVGGLLLGVGSIYLIGELFPMFSVSRIAEETARLQQYGQRGQGGSTFQIGSGDATSLSAQLTFAPVALVNSLFRPFIFEVHNAVALLNGLETLAISVLLIMGIAQRGARNTLAAVIKVPSLLFCATFVVLFGLGVGLGTTNLGTLSRYRVPMMPFYISLLLLLPYYGLAPWESRTKLP